MTTCMGKSIQFTVHVFYDRLSICVCEALRVGCGTEFQITASFYFGNSIIKS